MFVGRETELAELCRALDDSRPGRGRLYLVYGEPGIGKTRVCDELGAKVVARGVQLYWGRCWEAGGAPAYWPWLGEGRAALATIVPELATAATYGVRWWSRSPKSDVGAAAQRRWLLLGASVCLPLMAVNVALRSSHEARTGHVLFRSRSFGSLRALYLRHLAPRGVLLANVSNRHLAVDRVVRAAARAHGLACEVIETQADAEHFVSKVRWAVIARDAGLLAAHLGKLPRAAPSGPDVLWTDVQASVWSILR